MAGCYCLRFMGPIKQAFHVGQERKAGWQFNVRASQGQVVGDSGFHELIKNIFLQISRHLQDRHPSGSASSWMDGVGLGGGRGCR